MVVIPSLKILEREIRRFHRRSPEPIPEPGTRCLIASRKITIPSADVLKRKPLVRTCPTLSNCTCAPATAASEGVYHFDFNFAEALGARLITAKNNDERKKKCSENTGKRHDTSPFITRKGCMDGSRRSPGFASQNVSLLSVSFHSTSAYCNRPSQGLLEIPSDRLRCPRLQLRGQRGIFTRFP